MWQHLNFQGKTLSAFPASTSSISRLCCQSAGPGKPFFSLSWKIVQCMCSTANSFKALCCKDVTGFFFKWIKYKVLMRDRNFPC